MHDEQHGCEALHSPMSAVALDVVRTERRLLFAYGELNAFLMACNMSQHPDVDGPCFHIVCGKLSAIQRHTLVDAGRRL